MSSCDAHSFLFHTKNMVRRVTFDRLNDAALNATRARAIQPIGPGPANPPATPKLQLHTFDSFECGSSEVTRYTYISAATVQLKMKSEPFQIAVFLMRFYLCSCLVMTSRCSTADPCRRRRRRHTASPFSIRFSPHLRHFDFHFLAEPTHAERRNANPI